MRLDNLVLALVSGLALALAATTAWRGRRLPIVAPVELASVGRSALDALRTVACVLTAALGAGVLVVGLGGRLVMRILAATSGDSAQGVLTEAQETVGEITFGGTMAFIVFVGIGFSLLASFGYLALRRILPTEAWVAGLVFGVIMLGTLGVEDPLSPDNVDFAILAPRWLATALIAATALLFGMTFTALAARLDRAVPLLAPRGSRTSRRSTLAYGSLLFVLLPIFLVPTVVYIGARSLGRGRLGSLLARPPVHVAGAVLVTILVIGAVGSVVNAAAEIV